jgi:hypothetical protein
MGLFPAPSSQRHPPKTRDFISQSLILVNQLFTQVLLVSQFPCLVEPVKLVLVSHLLSLVRTVNLLRVSQFLHLVITLVVFVAPFMQLVSQFLCLVKPVNLFLVSQFLLLEIN